MTQQQKIHFVIILETEIRKAALLVEQAIKCINDTPTGERLSRDAAEAVFHAIDACSVALHGTADKNAVLMLAADNITQMNWLPGVEP